MIKELKLNQRGVVSILTVIFIAIILTVLTTSFIRLTINEQRESIDDDLTTRAYYAAESGVQEAVAALKTGTINNADVCTPHSGVGGGELSDFNNLDVEYTCQFVNEAPDDFQSNLAAYSTSFFRLDSASATPDDIRSVEVSWHIKGVDDNGTVALRPASTTFPNEADWNAAFYPAMIRVQLVAIPDAGTVDRDAVENTVAFLDPASAGGTSRNISGADGAAIQTLCNSGASANEYICSYMFTGILDGGDPDPTKNREYWIRIQPLYAGTSIRVVARDAVGNAVALKNVQAVVDVTGRAGDVYRRVEERVSLVSADLWPDYAILTEEDICKDFIITEDPAEFDAVNGFTAGSETSCR